jgi:hypothetical protein
LNSDFFDKKNMNRLFVTTFLLLVAAAPLHAESDTVTHCYINLHGGIAYGLYRDLGTSPLTYRGLHLAPGLSVLVQKPQWRYESMLLTGVGGYGLKLGINNMQTYGGHAVIGFRAWRQFVGQGGWHLWAGGSVDNLFEGRYTPSLGNACAGFGNYARVNADGCVEFRYDRWLFHARIQLNLISLNMRPGFSYMDNYDQNIASETANAFDQYRSYLSVATSAATDMGATLQLASGNRIGVSYCWSYLTSRTTSSAPHLFQYADHAILFHLGFVLK